MTNYSKYSPVTNTCVHKSVSSHISLCTPSVYVLACILRKFLGIGGHNSVRHHMAPDIGTAVLLRMDPKLGQTTSELINTLLSSKQPCVLETQMMWGSQHSVTKESTVPECDAVSLGKTTFWSITVLSSSGARISSWTVQPLKMKALWIFKMVGNTRPPTASNPRRPKSSAMKATVTISWDT